MMPRKLSLAFAVAGAFTTLLCLFFLVIDASHGVFAQPKNHAGMIVLIAVTCVALAFTLQCWQYYRGTQA